MSEFGKEKGIMVIDVLGFVILLSGIYSGSEGMELEELFWFSFSFGTALMARTAINPALRPKTFLVART